MQFLLSLLFGLTLASANALPLLEQSEKLIQDRLPGAHVGFEVRDADTGEVLLVYQPFDHFTPASSLKLMTAAAAVRGLGKTFHFETAIWTKKKTLRHHAIKGDLWWQFVGDPHFSYKNLDDMVKELHKLGVKTIQGDVVLDGSRFKGRQYPRGWTEDSLPWAYSAPVTAEMVDHNAIYLNILPAQRLGDAVKIIPDKLPVPLKIDAKVTTVTEEAAESRCNLWVQSDWDNTLHLRGCWPISTESSRLHLSVLHPQPWVEKMVKQAFAKHGIVIKGIVHQGEMPKYVLKQLVSHTSKPMPDLIKILLKYSDNLTAESLLKTLGDKLYHEGSFVQGIRARESLLASWAGLDFSRTELFDGSGESRYNIVTPHQLAKLMVVLHQDKQMQLVIDGLPISGKDGTLTHRMQVFHLAKRVQAKTGSLRHVSSLTGTMQTRTGRTLAFSILMDRVLPGIDPARFLQHELCDLWYNIR